MRPTGRCELPSAKTAANRCSATSSGEGGQQAGPDRRLTTRAIDLVFRVTDAPQPFEHLAASFTSVLVKGHISIKMRNFPEG